MMSEISMVRWIVSSPDVAASMLLCLILYLNSSIPVRAPAAPPIKEYTRTALGGYLQAPLLILRLSVMQMMNASRLTIIRYDANKTIRRSDI